MMEQGYITLAEWQRRLEHSESRSESCGVTDGRQIRDLHLSMSRRDDLSGMVPLLCQRCGNVYGTRCDGCETTLCLLCHDIKLYTRPDARDKSLRQARTLCLCCKKKSTYDLWIPLEDS